MQSSINRDGFLPPDPDELVAEGELPFADAADESARDKADQSLHHLQRELKLLHARIALLRADAEAALKAKATSLDVNAHVQLGDYPWLKLAIATGAAFVVARAIRNLPFGVLLGAFAGHVSQARRW
ncbi:hypothetical protein [Rhizobium binae]|uniref:hypothetical protein n=1 Tax=Rhizobium binae TaxID=1138190 RepID=UPI001C829515|nr:hypothetical protein [Rhizobium binae]MBX4966284.1 hypothetical protein [Rhizobium binae]